jgi:hypothetical protein
MFEVLKKNKELVVFLMFLVIGLALYANSFGNALFWDDDDLIVKNSYVQNFNIGKFFTDNEIAGSGQVSNYWRPFLLVSFAIDYKLWGLSPIGFHLTNTVLHILAAWLVFIFLFLLISSIKKCEAFSFGRNFLLSFLPALLFLVHPLNTEAVTYISGRGDPLSAVFSLLAIIFYTLFSCGRKKANLLASLLFFVAGLLTKEQVIFLPLLIILIEALIGKGDGFKKTVVLLLKKTWPFLIILISYIVLRLSVLNFNDLLGGVDYGLSDSYNISVWQRLFTFCLVMLLNVKLLFAPLGLHMSREITPVVSFFSWPVLVFILSLAVIIFVCVKTWKENRLIAFGFLWFLVLLLPRTNIISINRPMYEHWLYLPMVGFWLFFFSLFFVVSDHFSSTKKRALLAWTRVVFCAMIITYCAWLGILTIGRNRDWRDPIIFYEKNLKYTPNSYIQHNNLGMAYADVGRIEEAVSEYGLSLSINDVYPQVHYNLANSLLLLNDFDGAEKEYLQAIKMNSSFGLAYNSLYKLYIYRGQAGKAKEVLEKLKSIMALDSVGR